MTDKHQDASQAQGEVERLSVAMLTARATFERIRVMLINELDEPVRRAFWAAVAGRDALGNAMPILSPAPGATAQDGVERIARAICRGEDCPEERWPEYEKAAREVVALTPTPTIPAGMVAVPRAIAVLIDQAFLPTNPAKMRSAAPEVVDAARQFKAVLAAAPKQAEQQGVERPSQRQLAMRFVRLRLSQRQDIAKAMGFPLSGQGTDLERDKRFIRAVWEAGREADLLAALNAPTGAVEKGEAK